ncbi:rhomboid family intramembrane serine protease [Rubritalea sp.]|uniref:rhomboid family intramembrane serine protease n=1 Tax=Rubritalea sp. TaxID=2109375 RepID=UPI003EFB06C9
MKVFSLTLVLIYVGLSLSGQYLNAIYEIFGLSLEGIESGRVWQLLSYGVLHGSWWHLGVNVALLLLLGIKLQHILGWKKALVVTGLGVFVGGLCHLLLNVFLPVDQQGVLVGVSGGMMALLICLTTLDPDYSNGITRIRARHLGMGFFISSLILTLLTPSLGIVGLSRLGESLGGVFGYEMFYVSHACHFGGGIAGLIYGRYILRMIR